MVEVPEGEERKVGLKNLWRKNDRKCIIMIEKLWHQVDPGVSPGHATDHLCVPGPTTHLLWA